jgi:hypothetical protein
MRVPQLGAALLLTAMISGFGSEEANALCASLSASASPLGVSTGTYTAPNAPAAQPVSITISGTYTTILGALGGDCPVGVTFNRASLPATMAITGGGAATLPYTLQSAANGGNTLLYTGAGLPDAANIVTFTLPATLVGVQTPFTRIVTVWALAQPVTPQQAGSYLDGITLDIFSTTLAGVFHTKTNSQTFTVTGTVAKSCTIGGVAHPSADTATIPITASGAVATTPIDRSYANAVCNTPSNLQLISQNGAVKATAAVAGLANLIDYAAAATFSGARATLNTAAVPTAVGAESGVAIPTIGNTSSGSLSVTIKPQPNTQPLLAGAYSDTLSITLTPQ